MLMKTEINGYAIKDYNVHGLKDGARYSHCPLCSNSRRASNQKTKCSSLDWDRGLGTCHHCGETFQLHTYGPKKELRSWYAMKSNPNGSTTYYHEDGTQTTL